MKSIIGFYVFLNDVGVKKKYVINFFFVLENGFGVYVVIKVIVFFNFGYWYLYKMVLFCIIIFIV